MASAFTTLTCIASAIYVALPGFGSTVHAQTPTSAQREQGINTAKETQPYREPLTGIHYTFAPMLENVLPAVVTVKVLGETSLPVEFPRRSANGDTPPSPKPKKEKFGAGGSGVIFNARDGLIVTNHHVVENAFAIQVALNDGRHLLADLLGADVGSDLALLRIRASELPSVPIGNSDRVRVGDLVVAVGNPFGLVGTATSGIISATMRDQIGHGIFEDYLQISAPINPGNSGGALVNTRGELIGINSVTGGGAGTNVGIGFAVPVNAATFVMKELIAHGHMRRGTSGIFVEDVLLTASEELTGNYRRAPRVKKILAGSAAAEAGVKPGDLVVAVEGVPVRTAAEFNMRTVMVPVGQKISMELSSGGQGKAVSLDVRHLVEEPDPVAAPSTAGDLAGMEFGDILVGNTHFSNLRGAQILTVTRGSPAYMAGFEKGDVIIGIDNSKVRSVANLISRVKEAGMDFRVSLVRDGVTGWIHAKR